MGEIETGILEENIGGATRHNLLCCSAHANETGEMGDGESGRAELDERDANAAAKQRNGARLE
jgi:hypothetical protein